MTESDSYYKGEAERYFQEAYETQEKGDIEKAMALYNKSIELFPTAEAYTFLGWAHSFNGDFEEAITKCRKAIEIDPDYGNPYNDIGSYLIKKGKLNDALPWLEKATKAKRYDSYFYAHYNLGKIWEQKGDWFKALAHYKEAVDDNPQYSLAQRAFKRMQGMLN